ncbi:MAG: glycosyltransferase [Usitatibacter sp.]
MATQSMHFLLDARATHWPDIERLDEAEIARAPERFVGGRNSWIAQTFVRLRGALELRGWKVTAGPRIEPGAITVVHRDDANDFLDRRHETFLVVVRADRAPVVACDFAIVQNGLAPGGNERFVPLWPQPGLVGRDASRGTRIERLAYHGRTVTAPAWFHDPGLHRQLASRGMRFDVCESNWEDYRKVDIAIAARDEAPGVLATKPATKLYNAWLAGVPMLAYPEPAYCDLRQAAIDFIAIHDGSDVLRAIDLLRANPRLYAAMVANGRVRGGEFTVEATRRRWLDLIDEEIAPAYEALRGRLSSRRLWFMGAMVRQKALSRIHKIRVARERAAIH